MWHSISAGVRAARDSAHLTGKSHPQPAEDLTPEDAELAEGALTTEHIVSVEEGAGDLALAQETDGGPIAPRGGYQDPGGHGDRPQPS